MPGSDGGISPMAGDPPVSQFEDVSPPPYSASSPDNDNNVADTRNFFDASSASECYVAVPSTSNSSPKRRHAGGGPRPRILNFKVEYRDQNFYFSVGDNEQIGNYFPFMMFNVLHNVAYFCIKLLGLRKLFVSAFPIQP